MKNLKENDYNPINPDEFECKENKNYEPKDLEKWDNFLKDYWEKRNGKS